MTAIIVVALIDLQLSYILALLGKEPLEGVATAIIAEIVGVFLVYCVKSFFETKEEKKNKEQEDYEE